MLLSRLLALPTSYRWRIGCATTPAERSYGDVKAIVDTILLKAALPFLKRLREGVALIGIKVAHQRRFRHEPAEVGEEFVQVLVGATGVIEPIVHKGFGDRLEDPQRVGAISSLKKRDGLFDQPPQFLNVAGRPIAVPVASPPIARSEQRAGLVAYRRRIDWGSSPTARRAARRRNRGCQLSLDPSREARIALGTLLQQLNQSRLIEPTKQLRNGLAFDDARLLVREFQQNGDNMLTISAPIIGAGTMRVCNAAVVQSDRDLVGSNSLPSTSAVNRSPR